MELEIIMLSEAKHVFPHMWKLCYKINVNINTYMSIYIYFYTHIHITHTHLIRERERESKIVLVGLSEGTSGVTRGKETVRD
jgi:hypothetical protein